MEYPYPEFFARFYDTLYHHLRSQGDFQLYLEKIRKGQGRILEVGVGTGRLFMEAFRRGKDIYGIDISDHMLNVLRNQLDQNDLFRISRQSAVDFRFPFEFDLIIAPFRMFQHLLDKDEQITALKNIRDHLSQRGRFIFDVFVPDLHMLMGDLDEMSDFEGEYEAGKTLRRYVSTRPDLATQLIHVTFKLEWEEDDKLQKDTWTVPIRFFFRYELEHLLERAGFNQYAIYGDFTEAPLNPDSKEFICECIK